MAIKMHAAPLFDPAVFFEAQPSCRPAHSDTPYSSSSSSSLAWTASSSRSSLSSAGSSADEDEDGERNHCLDLLNQLQSEVARFNGQHTSADPGSSRRKSGRPSPSTRDDIADLDIDAILAAYERDGVLPSLESGGREEGQSWLRTATSSSTIPSPHLYLFPDSGTGPFFFHLFFVSRASLNRSSASFVDRHAPYQLSRLPLLDPIDCDLLFLLFRLVSCLFSTVDEADEYVESQKQTERRRQQPQVLHHTLPFPAAENGRNSKRDSCGLISWQDFAHELDEVTPPSFPPSFATFPPSAAAVAPSRPAQQATQHNSVANPAMRDGVRTGPSTTRTTTRLGRGLVRHGLATFTP
ncbi:hypothetical protein B0A53_04993 [Rhodotorula sp. CCFEE 5036]|nr:hypothetical protein B0A53_04993 [Rhodotorula sp. CCFEE 5036]